MPKRKSMSLRNRFTVFKRDKFQCQYCGRKAPNIILEVDHIIPFSKGGSDKSNNLITSCFDCNRGKADSLLTDIPDPILDTLKNDIELKKEKQKQIAYINKIYKQIQDRENKIIDDLGMKWFNNWYEEKDLYTFGTKRAQTIKTFLKHLIPCEIEESINIAISKEIRKETESWKYFCGICWFKIKDLNNG